MIFWKIPPQTRRMHVYTAVGKTRIRVTQWTSRIRAHIPPKSHVETDDDGGAMDNDSVGDAKLPSAFFFSYFPVTATNRTNLMRTGSISITAACDDSDDGMTPMHRWGERVHVGPECQC